MKSLLAQVQRAEWPAQGEMKGSLPRGPAANQIFGCEILQKGQLSSRRVAFPGTQLVDTRLTHEPSQIQLFASPRTQLRSFVSEPYKSCVYVWGIPAHAEVSRADIPSWCADVVAQKHFDRFRELLGTFVVIVDEPREHRVTFVSDVLGIRPLFIGQHEGRLVFGSNVWAMQEAGWTNGEFDYGAVSSWIAYGYASTGGSLFADLRRLPPGAAVVFEDGRATEVPYVTFETNPRLPTAAQAAEEMHEIVSSTFRRLLEGQSRLSIPLSGGFDSRYLLALSLEAGAPLERIVNVNFTDEEREVSHRVADILNVPLEDCHVASSVWDLYDEVHHFMADGFPISKFVTYKVAERYPDMPMINGYLGGILIRGFDDILEGKHEADFDEDLAVVLQRNFLLTDLNLFRKDIAARIRIRSREPFQELVEKGAPTRKVFDWANMYNRQRYIASNNFLQHLGLTEALLPFYSWRLLRYKMEHDYSVFSDAVYDTIFRRYFPALAAIPHSDDLRRERLQNGRSRTARPRVAKCTARWARRLLPQLCNRHTLDLLAKERCIPLTVLGTSILPSRASQRVAPAVENALLTIQRLHLLEQRAREAKLDLDWDRI